MFNDFLKISRGLSRVQVEREKRIQGERGDGNGNDEKQLSVIERSTLSSAHLSPGSFTMHAASRAASTSLFYGSFTPYRNFFSKYRVPRGQEERPRLQIPLQCSMQGHLQKTKYMYLELYNSLLFVQQAKNVQYIKICNIW